MKDKKKTIILSSIVLGVLVLALGLTYALFSYQQTGNNTSQLIMGDIYMHYNETNQLTMENAMPGKTFNTLTLPETATGKKIVNPVMASQELNELSSCVGLAGFMEIQLDEGSTIESFCKGTGTSDGQTFQQIIDGNYNEMILFFMMYNVIKFENGNYIVNSVMQTQEIKELASCMTLFEAFNMVGEISFDEGTTAKSFCQGIGTSGGKTFQDFVDSLGEEVKQNFLVANYIIQDGESYVVNPVMTTQTIDEELRACVVYFREGFINASSTFFDEGSSSVSFCQGTGTVQGMTFQEVLDYATEEVSIAFEGADVIIDEILPSKEITYTNFIINPVMQEETTGEGVLGKCEEVFTSMSVDEGSTITNFCQGTGTIEGMAIQEFIEEKFRNPDAILSPKGIALIGYEIVLPENLAYFEFTISGKNTYSKKDIWYEVVLNHGDTPENRNTRIEDEFLKFRLVEVNADNSETEIFTNKTFSSLENKRIHVETIPKNTMNKINKTYRLYMWIDENVVIGNVDEDYTTEEWKDVFASIKVNVSGDFNEKALDASCFNYEIENNEVILTGYNTSCGNRLLIPSTIEGLNVTTIKEMAFTNSSIKEVNLPSTITTIEGNSFKSNNITNVNIPNSVTYLHCQAFDSSVSISKNDNLTCTDYDATPRSCFTAGTVKTYEVNENMTDEELNSCINYLTTIWGDEEEGNTVNTGETYKDYCQGTGTRFDYLFVFGLNFGSFSSEDINYFQENNIIKTTLGAAITDYDASCGSDVVIPDTIDGYKVTVIDTCGGSSIITPLKNNSNALKPNNLLNRDKDSNILPVAACSGAFSDKNLTSVILPSTLQVIKQSGFSNNQLTSLTIPNSVTIIDYRAFSYNQLTGVIFEDNSNLDYIGYNAFYGDNHTINEVTIPDSVTYLDCDAFNDDVIINKRDDLVCFFS